MKVLLFTTILFTGLMAGLLYGYSCSVNPGLKSLSDSEYIKAMQSINKVIQNPIFFITFLGLALLYPITVYQLHSYNRDSFLFLAAALAAYFVGVLAITIFFNVPLNEHLARFSVTSANPEEINKMRQAFENPWNMYHTIRTIASILSFGLSIISIIKLDNTK